MQRFTKKYFSICQLICLIWLVLFIATDSLSNIKIDSLKKVIESADEDTLKINAMNALAIELMYSDPDSVLLLASNALQLASKLEQYGKEGWKKGLAASCRNLGAYHYLKSEYPQALNYFSKAVKLHEAMQDLKGKIGVLGNIGNIYITQGAYQQALEIFFKYLAASEELNIKPYEAIALTNIGVIYVEQGDYEKALEYYFRALKIKETLGNNQNISLTLGNIGNVYNNQGNYEKALEYYFKALKIDEVSDNKANLAYGFGNIGTVYQELGSLAKKRCNCNQDEGNYQLALEYFRKALELDSIAGNQNGVARHYGNIGSLFTELGRFKEAENYLDQALILTQQLGLVDDIKEQYKALSLLYDTTGRTTKAYEAFKLFVVYHDSLFNQENDKKQARIETNYEWEKKLIVHAQEEKEAQLLRTESTERRNNLQYSIILLSIFLLFGGVFFLSKLNLSNWVVELIVFMPILILFEFTNVWFDPYVDSITNGVPVFKLLINVVLAGMIFPLHNFFETLLKIRMFKKRREKNMYALYMFIGLASFSFLGNGSKIDSLKKVIGMSLNDTTKVSALNSLSTELIYANPDTAILLSRKALEIAKTSDSEMLREDGNEMARSFQNLGVLHWMKGNYPEALENYFAALNIYEQNGNQKSVANILGNIGIIYKNQGDFEAALEYYFKALKIEEELNNKKGSAIKLGNIGIVYSRQNEFEKALEYYFKALEIGEELGDKNRVSIQLANIGVVYSDQHDYTKALEYYLKALKIDEELDNQNGIVHHLGNIGSVYTAIGNYAEAEAYLKRGLEMCRAVGMKEGIKYLQEYLTTLYEKTGRVNDAFDSYKLFIIYRDSIFNEENTKKQTRIETNNEWEKKLLIEAQTKREMERLEAEMLERRNNLQYSLILFGIFVLFGGVLFISKLSLPNWVAELAVFISFLILFEFTLVLLDPYVDIYTGGQPILKLLSNAVLAGLIFPVHGFFERLMKKRLLGKRFAQRNR